MFDLSNSTGVNPFNPQPSQSSGVNVNISNPSPTGVNFNSLLSNALLQQRHVVQQVNDEKDIYSIPMGVESSDFILSSSKPLIYFVATDKSGNKTTIIPFDIQQHVQEPEPTMQDVRTTIDTRLDERFSLFKNEMAEMISKKIDEALK